ncbi:hypothetical protein H9Q08_05115 [Chryseobacterium sp. PS-8]|uniref:Phage protein n=1 Tax=Chryseobacterium indicum TaxID=2766954 RepID=A0ABS9C355_9FLAO|nr:hypothetical protein [Chryseobacterium sp. PS-8]MCF2218678.1 hypothetical protein [Chryseobacterium sp. PS-8]
MKERDLIIKQIQEKLKIELRPENISKMTLDEYRDFIISTFEYINLYKDKYLLTSLDFREFANDFVYNYEDDGYEDNCSERVRFFMDELAIIYTYNPPFFWDSNFEDFKYKMKRHVTKGNGL